MEHHILDLDTIATHFSIEPQQAGLPLEQALSDMLGVPRSHIKASDSSLRLLREVLLHIAQPVSIPVPDYFEFIGYCDSPVLEMRTAGYAVPVEMDGKSIFLSNPNNPTGSFHDLTEVVRSTAEKGQTLVVDEAYIEFVGEPHSLARLVADNPQLVVLRTFSKFYGMTTDKVGYVVASPSIIERLDAPHPSASAAERAAAMLYGIRKEEARQDVVNRRTLLSGILARIADEIVESSANFVMARSTTYRLSAMLKSLGVKAVDLDRTPGLEGMGFVRIAVGSYEQLDELARRVAQWNS